MGGTPPPDAGSGGAGGVGGLGGRDAGSPDTTMVEARPEVAPEVGPSLLFDPAKLYFIQPVNGGGSLSVDVPGNAQANGTVITQQNTAVANDEQQFYILSSANNNWRIVMKANKNKCFDIPTGTTMAGTKIRIWDCTAGSVWQQWTITPDAVVVSAFQLKLVGNNMYLDEPASAVTPGIQLQVYTQNNTNAQTWVIKPVP